MSSRDVTRLALAATLVISVGICRGLDAAMVVALFLAAWEINARTA